MPEFELHPQLAADSHPVGDLALCRVLLMNDANYPWLILVPRRPAIREVYELPADEQSLLWEEVSRVGEAMMAAFKGHKLNIGALGNMVPQLHVHVLVRQQTDLAWPGPVWGRLPAQPYSSEDLQQRLSELQILLGFKSRQATLPIA